MNLLVRFTSIILILFVSIASIVKDILTVEKTPDYSIRAKTGWDGSIGWYVGYLERGKNVYFFATNLDLPNQKNLPTRIELTRRCLRDLSVL